LNLRVVDGRVELADADVQVQPPRGRVILAHMGCKLLGTVKVPADLAAEWDRDLPRNWRSKKNPKERLARSLCDAAGMSGLGGVELWDTMRRGSDYWRPGKLLTDVADLMRGMGVDDIGYRREDALCPPTKLLHAFLHGDMPFGEYARRYAHHLHIHGGVEVAVSGVVSALACRRLPVFYCVDPHVPGYTRSALFMSDVPYEDRPYEHRLRLEGCHRYVLAEEVVRWFAGVGIEAASLELDQTWGQIQQRGCLRGDNEPELPK
jgi:hypothetical protein